MVRASTPVKRAQDNGVVEVLGVDGGIAQGGRWAIRSTLMARSRPTISSSPRAPRAGRRVGVVSAFPPFGASLSEYGHHLVVGLAEHDDVAEVVVFADRPPAALDGTEAGTSCDVAGRSPSGSLDVTVVPCWEFNSATTTMDLARAVRAADLDALIWNLQFATFGDAKVPGGLGLLAPAIVRRIAGVPTTIVLHNLADKVDFADAGYAGSKVAARAMQLAGSILTRALLRVDTVALTIPAYVDHLRATYRADHAVLVPHGSFEALVAPPEEPVSGPRQIMAFGKWGTYKRVEVLIDALAELVDRGYDDLELVIAGGDSPNATGYLEAVEAEVDPRLAIRFTGYVDEDDVPGLFTDATVVAFPYTSTTGSSGVLHQAGSYARACVLPAIGDFVEVIEAEGFTGQTFEPQDARSLADAIAKLLDDPGMRRDMGRRNFAAAVGLPMVEVADWHMIHFDRVSAGPSL